MFVFHDIHMILSILFPGDLLRKLDKFVTTLHSSYSSIDCFHTVLNISLSFYHYAIHWFTFHVDGHSLLSSFWIWTSFLFHHFHCLFPMLCHCSLHLFYLSSYHIGFVYLPVTSQMVSWFSEMHGLNSSAYGYHAVFVFWEMSVNLGCL